MSIQRSASFTNTEDNINIIVDSECPGILIESIDGIYEFTGRLRPPPILRPTATDTRAAERSSGTSSYPERSSMISGTIVS